jgi:beta-glucosidase
MSFIKKQPIFLSFLLVFTWPHLHSAASHPHLSWPWHSIEKTEAFPAQITDFPENFVFGVGTSAYQVEADCNNSTYATWISKDPQFQEKPGIACAHDDRYKEDIQLMKMLGVHAYRFSIEWSKIEPREGEFDYNVLFHYARVIKELIANGIQPVIGFHHYSDPQWFMDLGGFEKKRNKKFFTRFCIKAYATLNQACAFCNLPESLQPLWLTFNSPAAYAANGYLTGIRPPGKQNLNCMLNVLANMLDAHVMVYHALKKLPNSNQSKIGITHNIYQLDPLNPYNPIHRIKCYFANQIVHSCIYDFFTTGVMSVRLPLKASIYHTNHLAKTSLDFVGLNYYGHGYMATTGGPITPTDEIPTQSRYTVYAEGIYRAIKELSDKLANPLDIPIYITENGVAADSEEVRELFLKRYLYAIARAIKRGYDVRGYFYWSFMDNFEWGSYTPKFGLFEVDRMVDPATGLPALTRSLRPSSNYFVGLARG